MMLFNNFLYLVHILLHKWDIVIVLQLNILRFAQMSTIFFAYYSLLNL